MLYALQCYNTNTHTDCCWIDAVCEHWFRSGFLYIRNVRWFVFVFCPGCLSGTPLSTSVHVCEWLVIYIFHHKLLSFSRYVRRAVDLLILQFASHNTTCTRSSVLHIWNVFAYRNCTYWFSLWSGTHHTSRLLEWIGFPFNPTRLFFFCFVLSRTHTPLQSTAPCLTLLSVNLWI